MVPADVRLISSRDLFVSQSALTGEALPVEKYDTLGVGPVIASALRARVTDAALFENGRHLSAWIGIVPENDSTGGKVKQKGLSKKGDRYLRSLLVNGAMALVRQAKIHLRPPDKPLSTSARVWYPSLALAWRHVDCVGGMATG